MNNENWKLFGLIMLALMVALALIFFGFLPGLFEEMYNPELQEATETEVEVHDVVNKDIGSSAHHPPRRNPQLPPKTIPLVIRPAGVMHDSRSLLIASVATKHRYWLLKELAANKGVRNINFPYEKTLKTDDFELHVSLSERIGQDDWDKLLSLPEKLDKHIKEMPNE